MADRPTSGKFRRGGLVPRIGVLSRALLHFGCCFSVLVHQWGSFGVVDPRSNSGFTAIPRNRRPPVGRPRPPSGKLRRGGMVPRIGVLPRALLRRGCCFSVLVHQWGSFGVVGPRPNVGFITIPRNRRPPVRGPPRILCSLATRRRTQTGNLYSRAQTQRRAHGTAPRNRHPPSVELRNDEESPRSRFQALRPHPTRYHSEKERTLPVNPMRRATRACRPYIHY